jgi:OsmC-like protein
MIVVREKTTVTQRIHGDCPTHSRTEISVRDVKAIIDEPKEREGTNMGPTPTETMVAALIACTNVITHKCAKKHGIELKAMTINAEWTLDVAAHSCSRKSKCRFQNPSCRRRNDGRGRGLLPNFQGGSQFGHGVRGGNVKRP